MMSSKLWASSSILVIWILTGYVIQLFYTKIGKIEKTCVCLCVVNQSGLLTTTRQQENHIKISNV